MNGAPRFLSFLLVLFSCFVLLQALDQRHSAHEPAAPEHGEDKAALDQWMGRRLAGGGGRDGGGEGGGSGGSSGSRRSGAGRDSSGGVARRNAKFDVASFALGLPFLVAILLSL